MLFAGGKGKVNDTPTTNLSNLELVGVSFTFLEHPFQAVDQQRSQPLQAVETAPKGPLLIHCLESLCCFASATGRRERLVSPKGTPKQHRGLGPTEGGAEANKS